MAKEFDLNGVVPWGRTLQEYCAYFGLNQDVLASYIPILDVGGGPSSFTTEAAELGVEVVAVDPIYRANGDHIRSRFAAVYPRMLQGMQRAAGRFVWKQYASPEEVLSKRRDALDKFLADYEAGKVAGRYRSGELPSLPFRAGEFRLALCSHLLFLYSAELDTPFHIAALLELLRVAGEVRVYPLLNLEGSRSAHLQPTIDALINQGFAWELATVPFEFQRGANQMLRAWRP